MKTSSLKCCTFAALLLQTFAFSQVSSAATVTWDGGGGDSHWGTATNWDPDGVPNPPDNVVFGNLTPSTTTVNEANQGVADARVNSLTYSKSNFNTTIDTSALSPKNLLIRNLSGDDTISNSGENSILTFALAVRIDKFSGGNPFIEVQNAASAIEFKNNLNILFAGGPNSLTLQGDGNFSFSAPVQKSGIIGAADVNLIMAGDGSLVLGDGGAINTSWFTLAGGTLKPDSSSTINNLAAFGISANSAMDFGLADAKLTFADSTGVAWDGGATLTILNFDEASDAWMVPTGGLTAQQLSQITFDGNPGGPGARLEANALSGFDFVLPIPEPGVTSLLLSGVLVFSAFRRNFRQRA